MFDLDETLAESFHPPTETMLEKLADLSRIVPFAIISGAGLDRIERDVLSRLTQADMSRISIFPNSGSQGFSWSGDNWQEEYNTNLTAEERDRIKSVIEQCIEELPLVKESPHFGERIADREAQIAFTVLGVDAPQDIKVVWDPDVAKRRLVKKYLEERLPEFEILTGGSSTVDITPKGIDKANGVAWYAKKLGVSPGEMFYVGDTLYEGGNDAVVIPTGIQTRLVSGPEETERIVEELLAVCRA